MTEAASKAGPRVLPLRVFPSTHRAWCLGGLTFKASIWPDRALLQPPSLSSSPFLSLSPSPPFLHLSLLYRVLLIFIMRTCVCVHTWCEQNQNKNARSPGTGVPGSYEPLTWMLETEYESSGRAACVFITHQAISSSACFFLKRFKITFIYFCASQGTVYMHKSEDNLQGLSSLSIMWVLRSTPNLSGLAAST